MNGTAHRRGPLLRRASGLLAIAALWEWFARSNVFPASLTPGLETIADAMYYLVLNGTIFLHIFYTLARVVVGLGLACAVAIPLGLAMGRSRLLAKIFEPALSALMPIPSLAWVPLFILWLGLGNVTTILVVAYAALFPMAYNVWRGVQAINPVWLRAANSMGSTDAQVFLRVVFPGSLPFVITGLRLAYGRAWMAVIGGELLAGTDRGLGRLIFEAKEWLDTGVMLGAILLIGLIALGSERLVFQWLDRQTIVRWGMVRAA